MNIEELPRGDVKPALFFEHFPTRWQAAIWRNWGLIPPERIALTLETSEDNIIKAARKMGLPSGMEVLPEWQERGYLTIIRRNWHLLSYEKLLTLLDWTTEKLDFTLREDDFMWSKMGRFKPESPSVKYSGLSVEEKKKTQKIKVLAEKYFDTFKEIEKPFDFIKNYDSIEILTRSGDSKFDLKFIYSYHAVYGDPLLEPELDPYPDSLLKAYSKLGVNGIWLQATLYTLYPFEKAPEFCGGYEMRIKNLKILAERALKFGIKIYLYINEPRGMPKRFFKKYPKWKGAYHKNKEVYSLCTSNQEVLKHLEEGLAHVFGKVPELGGVFCITMSENPTHCHYARTDNCPECSERELPEIVAEVVSAIEKGVHRATPDARVLAYTWSWHDDADRIIKLLPQNVEILPVSEHGKEFTVNGVKGKVHDYSMSITGPSESTKAEFSAARCRGMKIAAKVQLNNSWESSATPYLPVPYLVREHLDKLITEGVEGLMLSWTLGGYPSWNLELIDKSVEELAEEKFGSEVASKICRAWKFFSDAFREFPFHILVLYMGPQNYGPANLFYGNSTGYNATMIGFPYDDLEHWRANFPENIFEEQFAKLCAGWEKGLEQLGRARKEIPGKKMANYEDMMNVSKASYCHFKSSLNIIRFVKARDAGEFENIPEILEDEIRVTEDLLEIMMKDSRIGFEASNHYYYTKSDMIEKIINCNNLMEKY